MKKPNLVMCDLDDIARTAHIVGPSSAAAKALDDQKRRIEAGEDAVIYMDHTTSSLVVGPRIAPDAKITPAVG